MSRDRTIAQLTALAGSDLASADAFVVYDASAPSNQWTKRIMASDLASALGRLGINIYNVVDSAYGAVGNGTVDCTAAIQAAVNAAIAAGGGIVYFPTPAVSYKCTGTVTVGSPGCVQFVGTGQRTCKISYTGTGDFIVLGANDGSHSGAAAAYDGVAPFCRFKGLWLEGPNGGNLATFTSSRGIVDWENGSLVFEDVFIQKFGTGFYGVGSDVNSWHDCLVTTCATGIALYSRCDQNSFYDLYAYGNNIAVLIESVDNARFFGGQFVSNAYADVVFDQPATSTVTGTDVRLSTGTRFYGTWFESVTGTTTPRHVYVGRNGASGRVMSDVQLTGCFFIAAQTTNVIEVDAASDIKLVNCSMPDGFTLGGALFQINAVTSVNQYVYDIDNRLPSGVARVSGVTTYYQAETRQLAGNIINQIKAQNPAIVLATQSNPGYRLLSDGQAVLTLSRNTGTEASPTWSTLIKLNNKNIEPGASALTWGTTITLSASTGGLFTIDASSNIGATISAPTNAPVSGQTSRITFRIKNTSGGALATPIAFSSAAGGYKTTGAFVNPANGAMRLISFVYDAALGYYIEDSRSSADIT